MLLAKDFRQQAWKAKEGKWGTLALAYFIHSLIIGACSALAFLYIGGIALFLITGPLTLGMTILSINVISGKSVSVNNMFEGFKDFGKAFLISLLNYIFIFLWSLLLIIPGIIKSFAYSMTYYISIDHPEMSANEARKESIRIMKGNKWRLFCLQFSFIGWYLLSILTFGILSYWVSPYRQAAIAAFYKSITESQINVEVEPVKEEDNINDKIYLS